jgi:hypothetical protein
MLFTLLLGVTNGLVGSVPMIQAPSRVTEEHRELTGNYIITHHGMQMFELFVMVEIFVCVCVSVMFGVVAPCHRLDVCHCFRGTYCLHCQVNKLEDQCFNFMVKDTVQNLYRLLKFIWKEKLCILSEH